MLEGIDLPFIASGGIYSDADIQSLMDAGAAAVQLDSWLWLA
jgi:NAD(P)H-dependent flavin oxidoreductase YrpB (nitropropane dioxygenase family)